KVAWRARAAGGCSLAASRPARSRNLQLVECAPRVRSVSYFRQFQGREAGNCREQLLRPTRSKNEVSEQKSIQCASSSRAREVNGMKSRTNTSKSIEASLVKSTLPPALDSNRALPGMKPLLPGRENWVNPKLRVM